MFKSHFIKVLSLASVLFVLAPSVTFAQELENRVVSGLSTKEAAQNLARVQAFHKLVETPKDGSFLRAGLVEIDLGGSTDLGPAATLLLSVFNQSEEKDAASVHVISDFENLIDLKRSSAGVYEVTIERIKSFGGAEKSCAPSGSFLEKVRITIDAQDLTAKMRRFEGHDVFGLKQYQNPIKVTEKCI